MTRDDFFEGLAQPLTQDQKQKILQNVYRRLEEMVGDKFEDVLSDDKFEELQSVIATDNQTAVDTWLEQNIPGTDNIVKSILDSLQKEVISNPKKFL